VERRDRLAEALAPLLSQNYELHIIGHSLGAGVAILLTLLLDLDPRFTGNVRCTAFSPPPVLSLELARSSAALVDSFIVEDDIIPRLSIASINRLHDELAEYAWQVRLVCASRVLAWAASPSCTKSTENHPRDWEAQPTDIMRLPACYSAARVTNCARKLCSSSPGIEGAFLYDQLIGATGTMLFVCIACRSGPAGTML
jgi:pimeloyl-ACP methyl ester carboxylesterase